ncbi:O-antigen ligase family protein [Lottiidibacillus patelloidae]|nr:O-antigen ligase family protein [Lottiidibacillus patelloidae]
MQLNKEIKFHEAIYFTLVGFIMLFPFLIYPIKDIYYSTFYKFNYFVIFILFLWLLVVFRLYKEKQYPNFFQSTGDKLAISFLTLALLSTLFSHDPVTAFQGSYSKYHGFLSWFCYISLFIFSYHFIPVNKLVKVVRMIVYTSFIVGIYGIIQHFFVGIIDSERKGARFVSSWGLFDNPNHFGSYLVIMLILSLGLFLVANSWKQRSINGVISCTLFVSLLYTVNRGGWIAAFIGTVILTILVVWKNKHLWKPWLVLMVSFLFLFVIVNVTENNFVNDRVASVGSDVNAVVTQAEQEDQAGSNRWGIWKRTVPLISEYYLIGSGPSTFSNVFPYHSHDERYAIDNSHNEYLEIGFSMGIPALIVYVAFILTIVSVTFLKARQLKGNDEIFAYVLAAVIISYSIKLVFNISVIPVAPFFWLILGIAYKLPTTSRDFSN